jgi:uncharacterized membrane protein
MSARLLRWISLLLAILGVALAGYLTYVHYAGIKPLCTAGNTCLKVQTSVYSHIAGVPVAPIGLIGYVLVLATMIVRQGESTRLATLILTAGGFAFSAYLTYRELFSLHAVCEECATSAVIMTLLLALSVWRFLLGEPMASRPQQPAAESESGEVAASLPG